MFLSFSPDVLPLSFSLVFLSFFPFLFSYLSCPFFLFPVFLFFRSLSLFLQVLLKMPNSLKRFSSPCNNQWISEANNIQLNANLLSLPLFVFAIIVCIILRLSVHCSAFESGTEEVTSALRGRITHITRNLFCLAKEKFFAECQRKPKNFEILSAKSLLRIPHVFVYV